MAQRAKRKRGRPVTHGLSRTRAYTRWRWLSYAHEHKRYSRKCFAYEISLCKEWRGKKGLIQFCKDMGEPPQPGARIEFIDITQPASKSNCYWKTRLVELAQEEVKLTSERLDFIGNHRHLLNHWELRFFAILPNYLKSNAPISKLSFFKVEEIYHKIQSALSTRQAVTSPPASTVDNPTPRSHWREAEVEKPQKVSEGNLSISQPATPATTIDSSPPEKTNSDSFLEFQKKAQLNSEHHKKAMLEIFNKDIEKMMSRQPINPRRLITIDDRWEELKKKLKLEKSKG